MTSPTTYKLGFPKLKYSTVPMASGAPFQRDPTSSDLFDPKVGGYYQIGTVWPNESTGGIWMLSKITGGNTAVWAGVTDAASGDVVGPASSTDNAVARFDGTTGKLLKSTTATLSNAGILAGVRPTLPAGTAAAATAPMKFTLGVNLTAPEAGAVEYDGTSVFYTNNSAARQTLLHTPTASASVDNTIPRCDGTAWGIQDSGVVISDANVMSAFTAVLSAGTATAGTAPLKFTSGVNLTSPEAGSVEYNGTVLTYTDSVPTRNTLAVAPGSSTDNGLVSWSSTTGYKLLSNTPTISSGVITFPSGGGNVLTAGAGADERKGSFVFDGSGTHTKILTTAAVTGCVIVYTIVALGTVTAAQAILTDIDTGVGFTPTSAANNDASTVNWCIVG